MKVALALILVGAFGVGCGDAVVGGGDTSGTGEIEAAPEVAGSEVSTPEGDTAEDAADSDVAVPDYLAPVIDTAGPYRIGFRVLTTTYTPKVGSLVLEPRTLRVAVWYPASSTVGNAAEYTLGIQRTNVHTGATPRGDKPMPIMVFSHGNLGFAESAYFITEHFASHGWLVLAPDHTGNTVLDFGADVTAKTYLTRPLDVSAVIDLAHALPADDPLYGRAGDDVVVAGHSFGGYTAFALAGASYDLDGVEAACAAGTAFDLCDDLTPEIRAAFAGGLRDPRVKAILPMAPGAEYAFGPLGPRSVEIPVLLSTGGRDNQNSDSEDGDPYWNGLPDRAGIARLRLPDAGHMTFSITCIDLGPMRDGDGCQGAPFIDPARAHRIISTYSTAFVRAHVFADPAGTALLGGDPVTAQPSEASLELR